MLSGNLSIELELCNFIGLSLTQVLLSHTIRHKSKKYLAINRE